MAAPTLIEAQAAPAKRRPAVAFRGVAGIWWAVPSTVFLAVFFVAPLIDNGLRSVHPEVLATSGVTFALYAKLLVDPFYLGVIVNTVLLSLVVTLVALIIGYPVSYYLVRHARRLRGLIIFMLVAPLLTSIIMRTYGWRVLLGRRGLLNVLLVDDLAWLDRPLQLLNSPEAVVIGLVHVLVPFMVLSIASVLQGIDPRLEESARILGAGRFQTFWRITLPLSLDGIGTGAILVFMIANGSFVTLLLLGGGIQTLPLLIYQQFNLTRDFGLAATMSNLLLIISLGCLFMQLRLIRRKGIKT